MRYSLTYPLLDCKFVKVCTNVSCIAWKYWLMRKSWRLFWELCFEESRRFRWYVASLIRVLNLKTSYVRPSNADVIFFNFRTVGTPYYVSNSANNGNAGLLKSILIKMTKLAIKIMRSKISSSCVRWWGAKKGFKSCEDVLVKKLVTRISSLSLVKSRNSACEMTINLTSIPLVRYFSLSKENCGSHFSSLSLIQLYVPIAVNMAVCKIPTHEQV